MWTFASGTRHFKQWKYCAPLAMVLLMGCASHGPGVSAPSISLPARTGWLDGAVVRYITTDVSDAALAADQGANFSPRLAAASRTAPGSSLLERVYKIANFPQNPVFQSGPGPVGPTSQDAAYSPLWRLVLVTWKTPEVARELRSEQEILEAEDRGWLSIQSTDLVLNCPILSIEGRGTLAGVR